VWVCFAVKEEARAFQKLVGEFDNLKVILVGMGKRNAERVIRAALEKDRPRLMLTCGFAGGLSPELAMGTVVFTADPETGLEPALLAAQPFHFLFLKTKIIIPVAVIAVKITKPVNKISLYKSALSFASFITALSEIVVS